MIEWLWPWMLLLAPLPWVVRRFAPAVRSRDAAIRAPFFEQWQQLRREQTGRSARGAALPQLTLWLIWLLLLLAAARPTWIGEPGRFSGKAEDLRIVDLPGVGEEPVRGHVVPAAPRPEGVPDLPVPPRMAVDVDREPEPRRVGKSEQGPHELPGVGADARPVADRRGEVHADPHFRAPA